MAMLKLSSQEKASWQRTYTLAARLDELCPWEWMGVADCFGSLSGAGRALFAVFADARKAFPPMRF